MLITGQNKKSNYKREIKNIFKITECILEKIFTCWIVFAKCKEIKVYKCEFESIYTYKYI